MAHFCTCFSLPCTLEDARFKIIFLCVSAMQPCFCPVPLIVCLMSVEGRFHLQNWPVVFSHQFLQQLGLLPTWQFGDVFGMDPELLSLVPRPVCSILLLFPVTGKVCLENKIVSLPIKNVGLSNWGTLLHIPSIPVLHILQLCRCEYSILVSPDCCFIFCFVMSVIFVWKVSKLLRIELVFGRFWKCNSQNRARFTVSWLLYTSAFLHVGSGQCWNMVPKTCLLLSARMTRALCRSVFS